MVIRQVGASSRGRFVFRALVSYVARQAGVSAVRVGGGLRADQTRSEWIRALEDRAKQARCAKPGLHIVVSATNEEARRLGQERLLGMLDEVARVIGCADNQRVAAVHTDSEHLHVHCVISLITPALSVVDFTKNQRAILTALAKKWERGLEVPVTPAYGSPVPGKARDVETWTMLPSFTRWAQAAVPAMGIARATSGADYLERWARLGVWYEPTPAGGGVLATVHDGRIIRVKASRSGFTPSPKWNLVDSRNMLVLPSAYHMDQERLRARLRKEQPTYAVFLAERERWVSSGFARAREVRDALRQDRAGLSLEIERGRRLFTGAAYANHRMLYRAVVAPTLLAAARERHAAARAEITQARPPSRYGEWLRDRARASDTSSLLTLEQARIRRKRIFPYLLQGEQTVDTIESTQRTVASDLIADFAADPDGTAGLDARVAADAADASDAETAEMDGGALRDLVLRQIAREGSETPVAVLQALTYLEQNPTRIIRTTVSRGASDEQRQQAFEVAVREATLRSAPTTTAIGPRTLAAAVDVIGVVSLSGGRDLAESLRSLHSESVFRLPRGDRLSRLWLASLAENIATTKPGELVDIPLGGRERPIAVVPLSAEAKAVLKTKLSAALALNASWASVHRTLGSEGFGYRLLAYVRNGDQVRGAQIVRMGSDGPLGVVARAGEIGHSLKTLEMKLGPYVSADQISERRDRKAVPQGRPISPIQPEIDGQEFVEAPYGELCGPAPLEADAAMGEIGGDGSDLDPDEQMERDEDEQRSRTRQDARPSGWRNRLDEINNRLAENIAAAHSGADSAERDGLISHLTLEALRARARVNIEEHPRAAWAGALADAPDKRFTNHGTRFEYDRLQHALAGLEIVSTGDSEYGNAVFLGTSQLPAFYDVGKSYRFTAMTGTEPEALKAAILASERRWGAVEIKGNDAFQKHALQAAAELGVRVSNPDLQEKWSRLRDRALANEAKLESAYLQTIASLEGERKGMMHAFGRTDTSVVSAVDLDAQPQRTTAHVIVRGVFEEDGKQIVVVQTGRGNLQAIEATDDLMAGGAIESAARNSWSSGVAITSGGGAPPSTVASPDVSERMQQVSVNRYHNTETLVTKDREVGASRQNAIEAIQRLAGAYLSKDPVAREILSTVSKSKANESKRPKADRPKDGRTNDRDRGRSR